MSAIYYRVTSDEPLDFCRDFRSRRTAQREKFIAFAKEQGAVAFMEAWGACWGLIFPHGAEIPKGWKAERRKTSDGSTIHSPHKKTDEGKGLAKALAALGREPAPDEFAKRFSIPRSLSYRKSESNYGNMLLTSIFPNTSYIAWTDPGDSFWVLLPDIDGQIARQEAEGYTCEPSSWVIPEGLERSTRAHYDLAAATAKVAEIEAESA